MFLLVSGRHVGAHLAPTWRPIQISINLDDILRIARELKTAETWFLARLLILQSSIISQILEFIYWTVTIFIFDHMTDENREFFLKTYYINTIKTNYGKFNIRRLWKVWNYLDESIKQLPLKKFKDKVKQNTLQSSCSWVNFQLVFVCLFIYLLIFLFLFLFCLFMFFSSLCID